MRTEKDHWLALRGLLKDILSRLGGGEAYLRNERDNFYPAEPSTPVGDGPER